METKNIKCLGLYVYDEREVIVKTGKNAGKLVKRYMSVSGSFWIRSAAEKFLELWIRHTGSSKAFIKERTVKNKKGKI